MKMPSLVSGLLIGLLVGCTTSPTGRTQLALLPEDQLQAMGAQAFAEMRKTGKQVHDRRTQAYVECVVEHIAAGIGSGQDWQVAVFDDDDANAFALPGGRLGVNTGLLRVARSPDQLAAVIGHEIAHVTANHHNARLSAAYAAEAATRLAAAAAGDGISPQLMGLLGVGVQYGVINPYSRSQESEADLLGLSYMASAGFDPRASIALWRAMAAEGGGVPGFLSTHPSHGARIELLSEAMPDAVQRYQSARERGRRPDCG